MKNYYEILEISQIASPEVIEKAYKTLAKKYHPDRQEPNQVIQAEEKFKELGEAYEILSNPQKRKAYDIELDKFNSSKSIFESEKYQKLLLYSKNLENELKTIQKNQSDLKQFEKNTIDYNIQKAYNDAYNAAYVEALKKYGYKTKRKKSFKTVFKNFITILLTILVLLIILYILWIIPHTKEYLINLYNENFVFKLIRTIFLPS